VEHLAWAPRASVLHNFLTPAEADHLVALATPFMARSTVVDNVSGERQPSKVRTSSGMFLTRGQDATVAAIEDRIARFTSIPVEHGEGLQVLNYSEGELYGEFDREVETWTGGLGGGGLHRRHQETNPPLPPYPPFFFPSARASL
jgi:prolyl 4-hydroxylase